jgi:serine/threonine protein phosphatase 1
MIAVLGDIHGCYHTLLSLMEKIWKKYPGIEVFSVGDLIDRGKFSYEVVQYFRLNKFKFCLGNHEQMFMHFVEKTNPYLAFNWLQNGYEATLNSYENNPDDVDAHVKYIKEAPVYFNLPDCFISHAGVSAYYRKIIEKSAQIGSAEFDLILQRDLAEDRGIIWTRDELMDIGKLQIVGHSRKPEVIYKKKSNALFIDTSAFTGHGLSAVIIEEGKVLEIFFEITDLSDY